MAKKEKYNLYELYDSADGNDDILSDIGNTDEIRQAWAIMPYNVSDGEGVINEDYDRKTADEIANQVAEIKGYSKPQFIGSGFFGVAYSIGNDKVLKITKDRSEAYENLMLIGKPLKYIAQPYNVFKITSKSEIKIPETYAIVLEKLQTDYKKTEKLYDRLDFAFTKILHVNVSDVIEHYLDIWNDKKIDKKKIDAYFAKNPQDAEFFYGLMRIAEEAKQYGVESMDYLNSPNLGYKKNGALGFFDVGFGNGLVKPQSAEKIEVAEAEVPDVRANSVDSKEYGQYLANEIASKLNIAQPQYLSSGSNGHAFQINDNVVLKITANVSEADSAFKVMKYGPPKYLTAIYKIYKVVDTEKNLAFFVILQENILDKPKEKFEKIIDIINRIQPNGMDFVKYVKKLKRTVGNYTEIGEGIKQILTANPEINIGEAERKEAYDFLIGLLYIQDELFRFGIKSDDYSNTGNLGYKNGVLKFFDIGDIFGKVEPKVPEQDIIYIPEDGSSRYSTDNEIGRDNFPIYNQNDTSPSIENDPKSNDAIFGEDLEYNHVDDATKDKYIMTERKLSYMPGAQAVTVKKKCRLGGLGNTSVACNQGDINNLELKTIKEEVDASKGYSDSDSVQAMLRGNKDVSLIHFDTYPYNLEKIVNKAGFGKIKVEQKHHNLGAYIIYRNTSKGKANAERLYEIMKSHDGYVNDKTPEEAYEIRKLLDYTDKSIEEYVNRRYYKAVAESQEINEVIINEKYYRAVEKNMGKTVEFEPEGYYEAIDDKGNPIFKYDTFWVSDIPEVAASKSIGGAVMGLYSMFMQHGKKPTIFYIYEINEKPDVDISHWDYGDFAHLKEVRYRKPVQGKYRGKVTITDDMIKRLNAFYEVSSLDTYDEPDEESAEIVQNTDYDQYLAGVKNMVHENVKVDLPSKLSGYDSLKIMNDGQVVGEVGIMDRGIQGGNHYIAIDKIFIDKNFRGKNYANDAMRILFEYADKNNIIVTLTPDNMWGASIPKLKAWYKSLGFVENKGRKKDFQTMQLMYRLPKSMKLNEENYVGKAYRVDSGFSNKGKTAGDVVRFEEYELGNIDDFLHITDEKLKELDNYPASNIVWVTKTFEDAKRYSNENDFSDIEEFNVNGEVIAEDGDGGYLILVKNNLVEQDLATFEKQIAKDVATQSINKKFIRKEDDFKIMAVNGDAVKDNGFIKFVDGGHHYVDVKDSEKEQQYAKNIPEDEIWIDDVFLAKPNDMEGDILHEKLERYLMKHYGFSYDKAHEIANYAETIFRKKVKEGTGRGISDMIFNLFVKKFKKPNVNLNEAETTSLEQLPFKQEVEQHGGKIYSVGGAVRDEILGMESKDLDVLITGIPMDELEQILSKYGRVDAVGKSFGILKFRPQDGEEIDIAIPRTEKPSGEGGHKGFDITSDHALPIEKDLERRDFTINAIAKDIDGNIVDPFGGQEDLKNKTIKVVNPEAFSDDPLRMLRAVQFASRFGFTIEPETLKMIQDNASRIKEIPPERILTEFDKIVKKGNKLTGAILLDETGLFKEIFGKSPYYHFGNTKLPFDKVKTMGEFIYLLLSGVIQNPAEFYRNNLKGDIPTYKEIKALDIAFNSGEATNLIEARSVAHNMYVISPQSLESNILPNVIKITAQELLSGKYPKTINELAINGNDLIQLGLKGKEIGDMQKSLLLKIYTNKIRNNREELLNLASQNSGMIKEETSANVEYGCLMLFLDVPIWKKITSIIKPEDLYEKDDEYGIEKEPHLTILYGFHDEVTAEDVFKLFKKNMPIKPIKIRIKGISVFENPEFDVVKFDVNSLELTKLNGIMRQLPNTTKFPEYHAHITIGYVKPGEGKKYVKSFEKESVLKGNKLVFSYKNNKNNDREILMLSEINLPSGNVPNFAYTFPEAVDELYLSPSDTYLANTERLKVNYLVKKYDEWNRHGERYPDPTRETVVEFLRNNYKDLMMNRKLMLDLYHELINREVLNESIEKDSTG
jgi:2'-5' RNA ligase